MMTPIEFIDAIPLPNNTKLLLSTAVGSSCSAAAGFGSLGIIWPIGTIFNLTAASYHFSRTFSQIQNKNDTEAQKECFALAVHTVAAFSWYYFEVHSPYLNNSFRNTANKFSERSNHFS